MAELSGEAMVLRIYIGDDDAYGDRPLADVIVTEARTRNMAGATAIRGILGYGLSKHIHRTDLVLSHDLPVVIEIIDSASKIDAFIAVVKPMLGAGLMTRQSVSVLHYGATTSGKP